MKTYALVAIFLIAVGIFSFAYQGITYTTGENAIAPGESQLTDMETTIPLLPTGGALALLAGISLLVIGERRPDDLQSLLIRRRQ